MTTPEPYTPATLPKPAKVPVGQGAKRHWARRLAWPTAVVIALVIGVAAGGGAAGSDPTESEEYLALAGERDELRDAVSDAEARADTAESTADDTMARLTDRTRDLDAREAEIEDREAAVAEREAAVSTTEQQIAATQIQIGTWTVGVDIEPGTYRTAEPVTRTCYWGIYRSGSNKSDIIDNDIVEGGHPTVTLSAGQDFENGCGVWNKQ